MVVEVLNKILLALKWAQLGPKRGQNEILIIRCPFIFSLDHKNGTFIMLLHTAIKEV